MMVRICLKEYLESLKGIENQKKKEERRDVPSMDKLARAANLHRGSLNRIAKNHGRALKFDTANAIIGAMREMGFNMGISDLITYEPTNQKKPSW